MPAAEKQRGVAPKEEIVWQICVTFVRRPVISRMS